MIELLEPRVAPAAVFHFTDLDGDKVTINTSKGTNADLATAISLSKPDLNLPPAHLDTINFAKSAALAAFAGTAITVTVVKSGGGDGFVDIGNINAYDLGGPNNIDLASVIAPKAQVGYIDVGDSDLTSPAIRTIKVHSMVTNTYSEVVGDIGKLIVSHDFNTYMMVGDGGGGQSDIHSLTIGGDMGRSNGVANAGRIDAGRIGTAKIRGDIVGGTGDGSGLLIANDGFGKLILLGSLVGGHGGNSAGSISGNGPSGTIIIGGDIQGGTLQSNEGSLNIGDFRFLNVKGSVIGGSGAGDGRILATNSNAKATVRIGGDIVAGTSTFESGYVFVGTVKNVFVGGDIDGGHHPLGDFCGVLIGNAIGHVTVKGQLINGGRVQATQ